MRNLALLLLLAVAALPSFAQVNPAKGSDFLIKLEADFAKDVAAHGQQALVTWFADDGVELEQGGGIASREDIKKRDPWPEGTSLSWTPVRADMAASGDLGFTYGNYVFKSKDKEGKIVASYGKYMSVWRKQKDGSWKVVADMGNSNPERRQ